MDEYRRVMEATSDDPLAYGATFKPAPAKVDKMVSELFETYVCELFWSLLFVLGVSASADVG
jgi:hypothetical protein